MSSALRGLAPREGLECLLVNMGRTVPLVEPRRGPQAGKSGDPRSQDVESIGGYEPQRSWNTVCLTPIQINNEFITVP